MLDWGWVTDPKLVAGGGMYCWGCAHLLRLVRVDEECTWCETPMGREEEAEATGWGYFANDLGELHPCCPACLASRFGIEARIMARRNR